MSSIGNSSMILREFLFPYPYVEKITEKYLKMLKNIFKNLKWSFNTCLVLEIVRTRQRLIGLKKMDCPVARDNQILPKFAKNPVLG